MANHTINKVGIKAGLVASRGTIEERFITFKINLSISKEETPPKAKPHPSVAITPSTKYKLVLHTCNASEILIHEPQVEDLFRILYSSKKEDML